MSNEFPLKNSPIFTNETAKINVVYNNNVISSFDDAKVARIFHTTKCIALRFVNQSVFV